MSLDGTPGSIAAAASETSQRHACWSCTAIAVPIPAWKEIDALAGWLGNATRAASCAEPQDLPAAEWLLDNAYQVQRAMRLIHEDLTPGFYRRLPALAAGEAAGMPRLLALAHDAIHTMHCRLSRDGLLTYLDGYQRHQALTIAELWALPVMLRLACIERLVGSFGTIFPSVPPPFALSASGLVAVQAADPTGEVAHALANLGIISSIAWKDVFDASSHVERILRGDPSASYQTMDFDTRDSYRRIVEKLARRARLPETEVAERAVAMARAHGDLRQHHIGYWLAGRHISSLEASLGATPPWPVSLGRRLLAHPGMVYGAALLFLGLASLILPVAYLVVMGAKHAQLALGIALVLLPATILSVTAVNWLVTLIVPPQRLPKLDFSSGIDAAWTTVVAMPVIVAHTDAVPPLMRRIEAHYLANPQASRFVLLSDPADAPTERTTRDAAIEQALVAGITELNRRYGNAGRHDPFCLLHRSRSYNPSQGCWMARERKRGKLEDFNALLLGHDTGVFTLSSGPVAQLAGTRFVVTADADTRLPPDTIHRLAGTLAHPLNRPQFDARGRVVAGYTVLQPRIEIAPLPNGETRFARLFGGDTAIDIYSRAVSDVYQDLTGIGNYAGKGIYDVEAFERSLAGRVPENALLSHDLWEGLHGRAGLVSDIIVYESFPANYSEYARRWHRWVRGDWQLLPWLFGRVPGVDGEHLDNRLSLFERLRILDNLRRSLLPASIVALLIGGWLLLPGAPWFWTVIAVAAPSAYLFADLVTGLARGRRRGVLTSTIAQVGEHGARWLLSVSFLITDSAVSLHAIATTLLRLWRDTGLLEWATAEQITRQMTGSNPRKSNWRTLALSPLAALVLGLPLLARPASLIAAAPLLALWLAAPEIALWTGRTRPERSEELTPEDRRFLRRIARQSWVFFETYVRPEDNWLPPDNHQEAPIEATAHRTSPTNVGLLALSTLSAWRFGHIGMNELAVRMRNMLDTLERVERWRGHMLNWYDTRTLAPLEPRYVSTVDSGNLAASLVTLEQGCAQLLREPPFAAARWQGLDDCLALLAQALTKASPDSSNHLLDAIHQLRQMAGKSACEPLGWPERLDTVAAQLLVVKQQITHQVKADRPAPPGTLRDLRLWLERSGHHIEAMRRDMETYLPWLWVLSKAPEPCHGIAREFAALLDPAMPLVSTRAMARAFDTRRSSGSATIDEEDGRQWLQDLSDATRHGLGAWLRLKGQVRRIARRAGDYAQAMDFRPLYDPAERLFHIGYNLSADRLDPHHYDLLASEARLASFFAIAKRDVPMEHWFQLGRPIVKKGAGLSLASWNGSMFEYLMPALFLRSDPGTLLGHSDRTSVDLQWQHGREKRIPWGISESAFASLGPDKAWRYRAFGLSELGLRRGLSQDTVIAPYASALALAVRPHAAIENLRRLAGLGMVGRCGFYEAIDFTPERQIAGGDFVIVPSYMAHHHGMSMAAFANALFANQFATWFHADQRVATVDLLLNERIPWELPPEIGHIEPPAPVLAAAETQERPSPWAPLHHGEGPALHILGNGRMTSHIGSDGCGELRWHDLALTRPGEAPGGNGHFIYLRDSDNGAAWSPTQAPLGNGADCQAVFHAHKAEFHGRAHGISARLEVSVAAVADIEIRRLRLVNEGGSERRIEVASVGEVALTPRADWLRHPAFAKLFVACEHIQPVSGLLHTRRPRGPNETPPVMLHCLIGGSDVRLHGWEGDRARIMPRHGSAQNFPRIAMPGASSPAHTLDPVSALLTRVTLPPFSQVELAFIVIAAPSRAEAIELAERHSDIADLDWSERETQNQAAVGVNTLSLTAQQLPIAQQLYTALHGRSGPRLPEADAIALRPCRDDLWALGLSGDLPILLYDTAESPESEELRFLFAAHRLWQRQGALVDVVLLHPGQPGYVEPIRDRLMEILRAAGGDELIGQRGGVHLVGKEAVEARLLAALVMAAKVRLHDHAGTIGWQLERSHAPLAPSPRFQAIGRGEALPPVPLPAPAELRFANGLGGFSADGAYVIDLETGEATPAPWANVLANEGFGCIVSEAGLGFTFAANSGENRLTPWHNDPVCDPCGEAVYLRDEETAAVWSVTPQPLGGDAACRVTHRGGETSWLRSSHGLDQQQQCFVASADPVKLVRLRLTDRLGLPRRLTATFFTELQMGAVYGDPAPFRQSRFDPKTHAILAENAWNSEFSGRVAFLAASRPTHSITTSRQDFLGAQPDWHQPPGLARWDLGGRTENIGEDAAAGLQLHIDIPPGHTVELAFILGQATDANAAHRLIERWRKDEAIQQEAARAADLWARRRQAVSVVTPDPAFDLMVNHWLPCQTIASRLFARAGFYQAGGAFGFRDQLQDALALLHAEPGLARAHILRAAAHQFTEGDVLHWWHPPAGRGVRTRCSDDLLWLPCVVARYVEATGDEAILYERVAFLTAPPLSSDEHDRYAQFPNAGHDASILKHCEKAFNRAWRLGEHGLPLIGDGDWNDGMNRIGNHGRGESVWLGWFMAAAIRRFAPLADSVGEPGFALRWLPRANRLVAAIDANAWDGSWYVRAFDDFGRPWGSTGNEECRIDSLAQSWAVICGGGSPQRASAALDAAFSALVRPDDTIVRLLDPPFSLTARDPGYIKAYPPGIRENGGQYSHAVLSV